MASFVVSSEKELIPQDWVRWFHNTAVFLVPVALVFIGEVTKVIPNDWQWGALALYVLNVITDIIRKWASANTYKK